MNVLSLFDGMSCAQIALNRAGIKVNNYFSSEIDKYCIKVTQENYPQTIQVGDIRKLKGDDLPQIDLIIGGSPCQGFSFSGKQLNFKDSRSMLFFEYVRLLKECKPGCFLLENVVMKQKYANIISSYMGVSPVEINSSLVSAQSRRRLYWVNWEVKQPIDKHIYLKDIIESGIVDRSKSYAIDANYFKGGDLRQYLDKKRRQIIFGGAMRGRYLRDEIKRNLKGNKTQQKIEIKIDGKSNCLSTVRKDNLLCVLPVFDSPIQTGEADIKGFDVVRRTYDISGKSPSLTTMQGGHREPKITLSKTKYRKLTPLECERLQTVPDNYTNYVSKTQRYKMLGNGFTVDVIAHILRSIGIPKKQLSISQCRRDKQ